MTSIELSPLDKFNKNLNQLLVNITDLFPDMKTNIDKHYEFPIEGSRYLEQFWENIEPYQQDISTKNEIIFSEGRIDVPLIVKIPTNIAKVIPPNSEIKSNNGA